ncbi:MAG: hypothetical protein L7F77_06095 [Candidatus Magnetominusculus sp. LBB02]|nr:hypothetical protein [Candidatus Magnetominusculus sp. LBB02]
MFTGKAQKTLIILIFVLLPLSAAFGDELYCVSLKKEFKISSKIFYGITDADFKVSNAEIYGILHKPIGWVMTVWKDNDGDGGFGGGALVGAGSIRKLSFFYDDFVIIKVKQGVKFNDIKLSLKLETDEYPKDGSDDKDHDGDKTYNFINKHFNIRRCKSKLF